jgi:hypothetical protein
VTIESTDGHEFIIKRIYAEASQTFQAMMDVPFGVRDNEPVRLNMRGFP